MSVVGIDPSALCITSAPVICHLAASQIVKVRDIHATPHVPNSVDETESGRRLDNARQEMAPRWPQLWNQVPACADLFMPLS